MQGRKKLPQTVTGERRQTGIPFPELPEPPAFLTDGAKRRFREVVRQLDGIGALAVTDVGVVARYAAVYDRWEQAEAALASSGGLGYTRLVNRAGEPASAVALPAMAQAAKCHDQLTKLESALGLNPVERARLPATRDPGQPDEYERLMASTWGDDDA
jgi:P27 family predicted phage terminase small subunit